MQNLNETKGLQEFFYDGRQVRIVQKMENRVGAQGCL
jgi:hypothetical protein